jgi:hypothetical protein
MMLGMLIARQQRTLKALILCTARYAAFCEDAYGRFLHHHPVVQAAAGAADPEAAAADPEAAAAAVPED